MLRGTSRLPTRFLYGAPVVLLAIAAVCSGMDVQGLYTLLVVWGTWHAMTQTYGVMRIYDAKVWMLCSAHDLPGSLDVFVLVCGRAYCFRPSGWRIS